MSAAGLRLSSTPSPTSWLWAVCCHLRSTWAIPNARSKRLANGAPAGSAVKASWLLGLLGALLSLATVFGTSMIYAQLKTVPRWNQPTTPALFLVLSLAGGSLLTGNVTLALVLLIVAGALQAFIWFTGDSRFADAGHTMETATGLGPIGKVRQFEAPHSGTNYLLREMVHVVGRKHAAKLRIIALVLMVVVPVILLLLPFSHIIGLLAVLSHIAGVLTARWLFFAEAEHVVGLYYGAR